MKKIVLTLLALSIASAAQAAGTHYFYAMAQTETDDPAVTGSYSVPECKALSEEAYAKLKSTCSKWGKHGESCDPKLTTHVVVTEKEAHDFPLVYYVFNHMKSCQSDREKAMTSGEML